MPTKSLYIIDGHAQIYRAFYAPFRDLTSPSGEPTRATFIFCQMLFNLIRNRKPDYLAMVMDVSDETVFRRDIDPNYKSHRDPTPETLHTQADRIVQIMTAMGIPIYRIPGFEADDSMATIVEQLRSNNSDINTYLVSRDKDLDQLITDRVSLYDPGKDEILDEKRLLEEKGYTPKQAVEIQTLSGDSTDNVPGVPGVGTKTAVKLITQYGTAEKVLAHADELSPKLRENLRAFANQLPITRQLVTLRPDVPLTFDLPACSLDAFTPLAASPIFTELGFTRLQESLRELASLSKPLASAGAASSSEFEPRPSGSGPLDVDQSVRRSGHRPDNTRPGLPGLLPFSGGGQGGGSADDFNNVRTQESEPRQLWSGPPTRGQYSLVDNPDALLKFVNELKNQPEFAFDTETTGLRPTSSDLVGISFAWKSGEAYYLPVRAMFGDTIAVETIARELKPIFENQAIRKIGQNLKFDMLVLRQIEIEVRGAFFDTMIASFLLDPMGRSHGLDAQAKALLNHDMIPITDLIGTGKNQISMDQVPTDRVCEYAAEDADFTWRIYEILSKQMSGSHVERLFFDTEMPLLDVLVDMENNGIALDRELLRKLGATMIERMEILTRDIHQAAGHSFNVDSTKQLAVVLFDEQNLNVVKKTKTGRSTDAETLEQLSETTDNPIPLLILEYRELAKLHGTYVDTLPKMVSPRTGRIHATFNPIGAITGRLSSNDPNLQNIPIRSDLGKQIRAAFVAKDDDHVLLAADYSQIELRIMAHFCQDPNLIEAFNLGHDIHRSVAAQVNGVSLEHVTPAQRSAAKAVNFGIIYGQTPFGLARTLGISSGEAKSFIDSYFKKYPGIRRFIDECVESARRTGYAETILGRRRPIPELQSRNRGLVSFGERIAVNTVVQGSAADMIKRAMVDVHHMVRETKLTARMLIQVHDELVFESKRDSVQSVAKSIQIVMESALSLRVPVVVDTAFGRNWASGKNS
ncbi:MAG: DNA polymerase I [Planctomycetota bacterium]|mgnify:CR=1 FL=1